MGALEIEFYKYILIKLANNYILKFLYSVLFILFTFVASSPSPFPPQAVFKRVSQVLLYLEFILGYLLIFIAAPRTARRRVRASWSTSWDSSLSSLRSASPFFSPNSRKINNLHLVYIYLHTIQC